MTNHGDLDSKLKTALAQCERLQHENGHLKKLLGDKREEAGRAVSGSKVTKQSSNADKNRLFRSYFRGRDDVFSLRWENDNGKSGYAPVCINEWKPICAKPGGKCSSCLFRKFKPLSDKEIQKHLAGKQTIGIYPLLPNDTCWFLVADFDKATWQEDAGAFLETCDQMAIPTGLERSRSGTGAHVWIFFENPVKASLARKLGSIVVDHTMEKRYEVGLDSYDRLFPSQDTMPGGGLGNLIALPFQFKSALKGNSLFIDRNFEVYPDQWSYISSIRKMKPQEVEAGVADAQRKGIVGPGNDSDKLDNDDVDHILLREQPQRKRCSKPQSEQLPERVKIISGNLLYVKKSGLPSSILNKLNWLAAFHNPEFYKAQKMRLSTFGKPRIISCSDGFPNYIGLPRGCLDETLNLFKVHNIITELFDRRFQGECIKVEFKGELRPLQEQAAKTLLSHDNGVLCAATGFGKTVVGSYMIANRKINTLVLVHRRQLMEQWREQLAAFLDVPVESIGKIGGGTTKPTGFIDIGMFQSLNKKGKINSLVSNYGQVIVDECHHIPAFSFEQVMKKVKAKYVMGLTATPIRKDGHHPIIFMQCGPVRFRVKDKDLLLDRPFEHIVVPRLTNFKIPGYIHDPKFHDIAQQIIIDNDRNDMIINDLIHEVEAGHSPLLLTERVAHLEHFVAKLKGFVKNIIVLHGRMSTKEKQEAEKQLKTIRDDEERVIIATGRYIGEGFDDARLDTLFLTMPIRWKGTIQQYAGRVHRKHYNKKVVKIYDYIDTSVPLLDKMYKSRLKGYKYLGYSIQSQTIEGNGQLSLDDYLGP